jgi:hypothetical protein
LASKKRVRAFKTDDGISHLAVPGEGVVVSVAERPESDGAWCATAYMNHPRDYRLGVRAIVRSLDGVVQVTALEINTAEEVLYADDGTPGFRIALLEHGGITTAVLREVPVAKMLRRARAALNDAASAGLIAAGSAEAFREHRRPGRRGRSDLDYAQFAASYVEWCGRSKTPVKDMAAAEALDESTVRNVLYQARERGLLSSSGRGRAGGALSEKAKQLIREADHDGTR